MNGLTAEYIKLFRGRGDAYGTWEGGTAGEYVGGSLVRYELTADHFERHLKGTSSADFIGVYPHLGSRGVTWGCIDIDGKDFPLEDKNAEFEEAFSLGHDWDAMWDLAAKLVKVLEVKSIEAWCERTRNGIHVWVFPEAGIVPAATMRRALMAACKACKYDPKEVNPKQEDLLPGKLGNYVRLPYHGALADEPMYIWENARYFVVEGEMLHLPEFLDAVTLTTTEALETVAALWTPPQRVTFDGPPPENVQEILPMLSGMAYTIWKDGPLEGRDRSNTLAKLAYTLRDEDIQMPAAFAIVRDADRRWGKFFDRPDCDEQIMGIVEHAYSV